MTEKNNNKRLLIILGIILGIIFVVAIAVAIGSNMQSVKTIKPSRLNDDGWQEVTSVLDEGGVALFTEEGGRGYLIVGKGMAGGKDLRDCHVKFHDRREDGQRVMHIDIDSSEQNGGSAYQAPDAHNRPLAIYQFKLRNADRIELRIDGKDEAFLSIVHGDRQNILR